MKKVLNKVSIIYLFVLIIFMNVSTALISMQYIHYYEYSKCLLVLGIVALILYILFKIKNKEKIKLKDVFIIILLIFHIISLLFAYNKEVALNGVTSRYEGFNSLLSYYAIFLLATNINEKWQKRLMYTLIGFGIIQIAIGTIQVLQIKNIFGYDRSHNFSGRYRFASGTFGNPNFYSTFILLLLMYIWSLLINNKKNKVLHFILFVIFSYGLIIGNTLGCIMSFILCLIVTLIRKINRQNIKKAGISVLIGCLALSLIILIGNKFFSFNFKREITKDIYQVHDIINNGIQDSTGNYRILIWKESLKKFPKYYLTGIGIDNFGYLNNGEYFCSPKECFDKAHNEYLQILLTEGLFTLMAYLSFIAFVIIKYKKRNNKSSHNIGLFYGIIAYLIQAFINISVIQVAPIFYLYVGFVCSRKEEYL